MPHRVDARQAYCSDPEYLRGLIKAAGISSREAARRLGVSDRDLRRWLQGVESVPYPVQVCLETLSRQE
ncbi:MAG: XRE family transcriptional regulator [Gammaproteobacteria bacterium PRO9]|nr:XRE family transcriptional regulator [Gammaproteobacteria bacterium PRO9]